MCLPAAGCRLCFDLWAQPMNKGNEKKTNKQKLQPLAQTEHLKKTRQWKRLGEGGVGILAGLRASWNERMGCFWMLADFDVRLTRFDYRRSDEAFEPSSVGKSDPERDSMDETESIPTVVYSYDRGSRGASVSIPKEHCILLHHTLQRCTSHSSKSFVDVDTDLNTYQPIPTTNYQNDKNLTCRLFLGEVLPMKW